jgi:hypothetical protein
MKGLSRKSFPFEESGFIAGKKEFSNNHLSISFVEI